MRDIFANMKISTRHNVRWERMTDAGHIRAFRLFELSHAESVGKDFHLDDSERDHLQRCAECRGVYEVFVRQLKSLGQPAANTRGPASPRFHVGDHVEVVVPGEHLGKQGIVSKVIESKTGDFIYRYQVDFVGGGSDIFFAFEIGLVGTLSGGPDRVNP
jgi:hypothetical protein